MQLPARYVTLCVPQGAALNLNLLYTMQNNTITVTLPANATILINGKSLNVADYKVTEKTFNIFTPAPATNIQKRAMAESLYLYSLALMQKGYAPEQIKKCVAEQESNCTYNCLQARQYSIYSRTRDTNAVGFYGYMCYSMRQGLTTTFVKEFASNLKTNAATLAFFYYVADLLNVNSKTTKAGIKKAFLDYAYNALKPHYTEGNLSTEQFVSLANTFKAMLEQQPTHKACMSTSAGYCVSFAYSALYNPAPTYGAAAEEIIMLNAMAVTIPYLQCFLRVCNKFKAKELETKINTEFNPFN